MRIAFTQVADGQKVPMNKGWNLKENAIYDRAELNGGNVAVLLAYCEPVPLCCLDIDDLEKAKPILQSMDIDPETYDAVRSRSGRPNSSRYFSNYLEAANRFQLKSSEPRITSYLSYGVQRQKGRQFAMLYRLADILAARLMSGMMKEN